MVRALLRALRAACKKGNDKEIEKPSEIAVSKPSRMSSANIHQRSRRTGRRSRSARRIANMSRSNRFEALPTAGLQPNVPESNVNLEVRAASDRHPRNGAA